MTCRPSDYVVRVVWEQRLREAEALLRSADHLDGLGQPGAADRTRLQARIRRRVARLRLSAMLPADGEHHAPR